jgi:hypothetical protein
MRHTLAEPTTQVRYYITRTRSRRSVRINFLAQAGLRHLDALEEARDNGLWDELWLTP